MAVLSLQSVLASIGGWIVYLFTTYPRTFFIALFFGLILSYILYRVFLKKMIKELFDTILKSKEHDAKLAQLASNRVQAQDGDKIAGLDSQLEEIYKQITLPRSINPKLKNDLGLRDVRGILLYGPPGTGKTLLARNLSAKLGCTSVVKVSAVSLLDKYYGSSEAALRELFIHTKGQLHCVILDELDSIAPIRTSGQSDSKFFTGMTNQLLSLMDGVDFDPEVIVIGTTNNIKNIDPAVLRPSRFDLLLEVKLPDAAARSDILKVYTEKLINKNLMEKYDIEDMIERTENYSGADLENVVRKATTSALYNHIDNKEPFKITEKMLIEALN